MVAQESPGRSGFLPGLSHILSDMRPILFGLIFGGALGFAIGNSFGAWRVREKMRKAFTNAIKRPRTSGLRVVGRDATPPPPTRSFDDATQEIRTFPRGQARP